MRAAHPVRERYDGMLAGQKGTIGLDARPPSMVNTMVGSASIKRDCSSTCISSEERSVIYPHGGKGKRVVHLP
jgi:hypothetical protein